MKLYKIYENIINEYLEDDFKKRIPMIEAMFNIKIIKTLGESSGIAYLTSDNKVLKVTSSKAEIKISSKLINEPSRYFPEIYKLKRITNNGWCIILKEFIPMADDNIKKLFRELETNMSEWAEHKYPDEMTSHKLIDVKNTGIIDFLNDIEPHLLNLYKDLEQIQDFAGKWVEVLDIHEDNIGWKDNHIVLFDY